MRHTIVAASVALLAGLPFVATADDQECDWESFGNGPHHTNAADPGCSDVDATTVSRLQARMLYRTRDSVTSTPTVVDDVLYVGTWDGFVYAFDATAMGFGDPELPDVSTVAPLWEFDTNAHDQNDVSFGRIVGTPAVVDLPNGPPAVLVAGGATLFMLEAGSGEHLAHVCLDPRETNRCVGGSTTEIEVESSPVVVEVDGTLRVFIGMDVHNASDVGRTGVVSLAITQIAGEWSLDPVWKFDPEGDPLGEDRDGVTYRGDGLLTSNAGTGDGCAGVWGTPAVDRESGVIVFGTASCKLTGDLDSGDVVGESVFAVDLDGNFLWRYDPPRPWGTRTDDDFGSSAQIFTVEGEKRVGIGDKQGWYYTFPLDPTLADDDGDGIAEPQWIAKPGQPGHVNENFAIGGIIGTPAVGTATVLDPGTGALVETTAIFVTTAISTPVGQPLGTGSPGQWVDTSLADEPGRMLSIHAIDARTGYIIWRSPLTRQSYGHPSFVNGVVFVPSTAGFTVQAYEASTGAPLWVSSPLNGAPSSGIAAVGNRIYLGAGTRQTDAGYKAFESDSVLADHLGEDPQERLSGIWAFELAG